MDTRDGLLSGRVALVTGTSSGLGERFARVLICRRRGSHSGQDHTQSCGTSRTRAALPSLPYRGARPLGMGDILDDMSKPNDPRAPLAESKRTAALLRGARSVLRSIDTMAATAAAVDDDSRELIGTARSATERLVSHLSRRQQSEQRGMKQAVRRLR